MQDGSDTGGAIDLVSRREVRVGDIWIKPPERTILGPERSVALEPRVMQVLLALVDAAGAVLARDDLLRRCWPGVTVGDHAVTRAIAEARRALRESGSTLVVETIPRVGFRLAVPVDDQPQEHRTGGQRSRRAVVSAAAAGSILLAAGAWPLLRARRPDNSELLESARQLLREELPHQDEQGRGFLRRAIERDPQDAAAWGMLALAERNVVEHGPPSGTAAAVAACERAARRALALDPDQPDAIAALALLPPSFGDWAAAERRLLQAARRAPQSLAIVNELVTLYQSAGLATLSRDWNARAARLDPLSPIWQFRHALKHWIFGDVAAADKAIDRARDLWPRHPAVWNARLIIYAFTDRPQAALAMFEDGAPRPPDVPPAVFEFWRVSLRALEGGGTADRARAVAAILAAAPRAPNFAINAAMILSRLGETDAAFDVAEGYLARTGPRVGTDWRSPGAMAMNDQRRRRSMFLFVPVTRPLRAHPRFLDLAERVGFAAFWRSRGVMPDYLTLDRRVLA